MFAGARVSGNPQAEQSRERWSPGSGGGVPGCFSGIRGERVKKKKKKIRVREDVAGFVGEG